MSTSCLSLGNMEQKLITSFSWICDTLSDQGQIPGIQERGYSFRLMEWEVYWKQDQGFRVLHWLPHNFYLSRFQGSIFKAQWGKVVTGYVISSAQFSGWLMMRWQGALSFLRLPDLTAHGHQEVNFFHLVGVLATVKQLRSMHQTLFSVSLREELESVTVIGLLFLLVLLPTCMFTVFHTLILEPDFCDSCDSLKTIAFLQIWDMVRMCREGYVLGRPDRILLS